MEITAELVKTLRNKTDAGMMDCKKALKETGGDLEAAVAYLRQKGLAVASKRADRTTSEGAVWAAIAPDQKSGLLLEVNCETDFVAKTDDFKEFVKNIAMHIAASNPVGIAKEDIPAALINREMEIYRAQVLEMGKPANMAEKIAEGKLAKFFKDSCLLTQPYVRDPNVTISDILNEVIGKTGENIVIKRFVRFQIGE